MPNLVPKLVHNFMAIVYLRRQIGDKIDTQISWPWKHFFASKIVLRVIVCCLRGVGSMSSNRHIPRFIVLFSSGHRWLFFVASLWAYVVVASFLCLRVVGSSFRRLRYILGQVLDVWRHNIYCTDFTCISYTFPFLLGTLLHRYPVTCPVSSIYHISVQNFFATSRGQLYKASRRPDVRLNCHLSALPDFDDTTSNKGNKR